MYIKRQGQMNGNLKERKSRIYIFISFYIIFYDYIIYILYIYILYIYIIYICIYIYKRNERNIFRKRNVHYKLHFLKQIPTRTLR